MPVLLKHLLILHMNRPEPLIGHTQAVQSLETLYQNEIFPHAVLLHGPKGIGKRKFAELAAQTLICGHETDAFSPNFLSAYYAQIIEGSNADYHVLEPESGKKSISIDQTRALLKNISLSTDTPRTIIIDAAENLTPEAANALLKTLEEPQPHTHFFLVCHALSQLLPTVVSRCRPVRLSPLNADDTQAVLMRVLPEEARGNISVHATLAKGCPGMALAHISSGTAAIQNLLKNYIKNPSQPIALVEKIAKQKQAPTALQELQFLMAEHSHFEHQYSALTQDVSDMDIYNLTPAWVLEKALRSIL